MIYLPLSESSALVIKSILENHQGPYGGIPARTLTDDERKAAALELATAYSVAMTLEKQLGGRVDRHA